MENLKWMKFWGFVEVGKCFKNSFVAQASQRHITLCMSTDILALKKLQINPYPKSLLPFLNFRNIFTFKTPDNAVWPPRSRSATTLQTTTFRQTTKSTTKNSCWIKKKRTRKKDHTIRASWAQEKLTTKLRKKESQVFRHRLDHQEILTSTTWKMVSFERKKESFFWFVWVKEGFLVGFWRWKVSFCGIFYRWSNILFVVKIVILCKCFISAILCKICNFWNVYYTFVSFLIFFKVL